LHGTSGTPESQQRVSPELRSDPILIKTASASYRQTHTHTRTHPTQPPPPKPKPPAGGNPEIGQLIADAMAKVGRQGVVTMEESKTAEDNLIFVEGMQFDRGYYSPYFVTDPERMVAEYENCKVLLVDKKISTARDIICECLG